MPDAINGTLQLLSAPQSQLKQRVYNLTAMAFTPSELASSISKMMPEFTITYEPDFRQAIADSWPRSLDDTPARQDWGYSPKFDVDAMTKDMITAVCTFSFCTVLV
jgi:threonine 3-dehydrogenase